MADFLLKLEKYSTFLAIKSSIKLNCRGFNLGRRTANFAEDRTEIYFIVNCYHMYLVIYIIFEYIPKIM